MVNDLEQLIVLEDDAFQSGTYLANLLHICWHHRPRAEPCWPDSHAKRNFHFFSCCLFFHQYTSIFDFQHPAINFNLYPISLKLLLRVFADPLIEPENSKTTDVFNISPNPWTSFSFCSGNSHFTSGQEGWNLKLESDMLFHLNRHASNPDESRCIVSWAVTCKS